MARRLTSRTDERDAITFETHGDEQPSLAVRASYAALAVPMQIVRGPLLATIPALYAIYGSISLRQIGITMMLLRLLDAAIDPLIGLFSDRTRSPGGRRKPWLIAGVLIVLPSAWALFAIPHHAGVVYFACSMGLAYTGWSMVEIPHTAWLGELSHGDEGRAMLSGWRTAAGSAGGILYLAIPLLPRFADAAMTPAVMGLTRLMILVLLPPALLVTLFLLPANSDRTVARPGLGASVRALTGNRPMRVLCLSLAFEAISSGMAAACYFFYLSTYLGIAGSFAYVGLATATVNLFSGLLMPRLISRVGKRISLAIGYGTSIVSLLGMAIIRRGPGASAALITLFAVTSLIGTCGAVAVPVMVAEAAGVDERGTGRSDLGNFVAATILSNKIGVALGGGVAFLLLDLFGFNPKTANGTRAMIGFSLTLFVVPILLRVAAILTAMRYPLGKPEGSGRWTRLLPAELASSDPSNP